MVPPPLLKTSLNPRLLRLLATIYLFTIFPFQVTASPPTLLALYPFEGFTYDSTGNNPPIALPKDHVVDGTIRLGPEDYFAQAIIENMSYRSFTVSTDFKPFSFGVMHTTILSGGPYYRWLGLQNDHAGRLVLTLNNRSSYHSFTNIISTGIWHTIVCTVDWTNKSAVVYLDGKQLRAVPLPGERFDVEGIDPYSHDKAFTYRNEGDTSRFHGEADNLRVYSRALTPQEVTNIFFTPRIRVALENDRAVFHWHRDLTGYVLETSFSLGTDAQWTQVSTAPVIEGDNLTIRTVLRDDRFYRLSRR